MATSDSDATKRRRRPGVRPRESREGVGVWTPPEHERFLQAQRLFPKGPWKRVAQFVGTRSTRQTMTHAQKHRQKLQRRLRGLRRSRRDATPAPESPAKSTAKPPVEAASTKQERVPDQPCPSYGGGDRVLANEPRDVETEPERAAWGTSDPLRPPNEPATPVPSPLVAARDPTAFLFNSGEVCYQDLLLMTSEGLCLPPFSLSAAAPSAHAAVPVWEEPLQELDALRFGFPTAMAPAERQMQSEFSGLDDALDYIIQSMC